MRTHWIALSMNGDNVTYFDSFGGKHIEKETNKFTGNRNIAKNLFRIQAHDSIMCVYFCIGFIHFMLRGFVRMYQFIFSCRIWNKWQNDSKEFLINAEKDKEKKIYYIVCVCGKYEKFRNSKKIICFWKIVSFFYIAVRVAVKMKRYLKKKNQLSY